jgi:hypothetical protein
MSKSKKIFISVFIVFNFLVMVRVHLPLNTKFFKFIYRPIDSYLSFFSIFQDWRMFAPNPSRINVFLSAVVTFDDGSQDTFFLGQGESDSFLSRYSYGERLRKVSSEAIRMDSHKFLWPDTARYALRKVQARSGKKKPRRVELYRHWDQIPDLRQTMRPHLYTVQTYRSFKFYTHEVLR